MLLAVLLFFEHGERFFVVCGVGSGEICEGEFWGQERGIPRGDMGVDGGRGRIKKIKYSSDNLCFFLFF